MEVVENGVATGSAVLSEIVRPNHLGATVLRRLQRLQAKVDGATVVAQAAINAHTAVRDEYERYFTEACEDYGVDIPPGPHEVNIDWTTGEVRFEARNG